MSHVTQCPACSTHFRVVADQLKIADGWVRCGQCGEVFDARVSILPWPLQSAPPSPVEADPAPEPEQMLAPAVESGAVELPEPERLAEPEAGGTVPAEPTPEPALEPVHPTSLPPGAPSDGPAEADLAQNLTFVRQAQRRAAWRRPWVPVLGGLLALALTVLLAGQVVLHERHRLAASHPAWLPWLNMACEPLACTIEPYRHIESVLIDSSALVREREDLYRLEVGLKNTSGMALAVPALELSLTDAADEVVLRRVLLPTDWDTPPNTLAPQETLGLSLRLSLSGANELRMAGYRVLVFYP